LAHEMLLKKTATSRNLPRPRRVGGGAKTRARQELLWETRNLCKRGRAMKKDMGSPKTSLLVFGMPEDWGGTEFQK